MKQFVVDTKSIDASTRVRAENDTEGSFKFTSKKDFSITSMDSPLLQLTSAPPKAAKKFAINHIEKWDEDMLVWEIQKQKLPGKERIHIAQTLQISEDGVNGRLALLREVSEKVSVSGISLADPDILHIWRLFQQVQAVCHPRAPMKLYNNSIERVSEQLGRSFIAAEAIIRQTRDLKHYLHFAGIHHDPHSPAIVPHQKESDSNDDAEVCIKKEDEKQVRDPNYSLIEKQYIFDRRLKSDFALTPYCEIATKLGRSEYAVSHHRRELALCANNAAMAVAEGVSLAPSADTLMWDAYMRTFPLSRGASPDVAIIATNVKKFADSVNKCFVQMQLRLKLIRSLKKYLFIAGVHEEPAELQKKFENIVPIPQKQSAVDQGLVKLNLLVRNIVDAVISDTISSIVYKASVAGVITGILNSIVKSAETNGAVRDEVERAVDQLVTDVQTLAWTRATFVEVTRIADDMVSTVEIAADVTVLLEDLCETVEVSLTVQETITTVINEVERNAQTHNTISNTLQEVVDQIEYNALLRGTVSDAIDELTSSVEYAVCLAESVQEALQTISLEWEGVVSRRDTVCAILQELTLQAEYNVVSDALLQMAIEMEYAAQIRGTCTDVLYELTDEVECSVQTECAVAAVLSELTHQVEDTVNSATEPDTSDIECSDSTSQQQNSLSSLPLPSCVLPFAFKLQDEGEIWRAYLQHQHQHDPSVNLCARLTALSQQLGCTFAQVRDHLNKLMNLQLGLSAQQHSAGRSFTTAEDTSIWAALKDTTPITYAMALLLVSQRLRCVMGAVAARHRQLRTLDLLETARVEVQSKNVKRKRKKVPGNSGGGASEQYTQKTVKKSFKQACALNEIAYFSTEGGSGHESM